MRYLLGDGFHFVATEPIHPGRSSMGYADINEAYPFVVRSYRDATSHCEAMRLGFESDVVITGSAPEQFILKRTTENKLTFRYSERVFKKGRWEILNPRLLRQLLWYHRRFKNKSLYMLCASAYTAGDFAVVGAYKEKTYKWGYFPEVREYDLALLMRGKKGTRLSLLWAGRFEGWKHPEKALYVAKYLKECHIEFSLRIIGGGDMDKRLKSMTKSLDLEDCVEFLGYMSPDDVRYEMERAEIYLFTSDRNEGWGAVLNEAMNSGCAVVASYAIGAVPYLLKDNVNGMVYRNDSTDDLCEKVLMLAKNPEMMTRLGSHACNSIAEGWSAKIAATRLIALAECLFSGRDAASLFLSGPCSAAPTLF